MSISRSLLRLFFVFALLSSGSVGPARAADEPFIINAIVSTTGPNSFNGQFSKQALEVFAAYANRTGGINGRPIQFDVADDQSNPQIAVQVLNQIKAKNAPVVIGSDAVAPCGAMAPLVTDGPVMFCTSPGLDPPRGSYAFASTSSLKVTLAAMVSYLRLRGFTKVALITATDAMGQMTQRYFDAAFALPENKSIAIVSREVVNPTDLSFSAQVERIKGSSAQARARFRDRAGVRDDAARVLRSGHNDPGRHERREQQSRSAQAVRHEHPAGSAVRGSAGGPHSRSTRVEPDSPKDRGVCNRRSKPPVSSRRRARARGFGIPPRSC